MTLLHNMGCNPRATISHSAGAAQRRCRGLIFRLPAEFDAATPAAVLDLLGAPCPQNAAKDLRSKLNEHANALALPPVALVSDQARAGDSAAGELLDICTVLAKSSGRVYLRDKEPNLSRIRTGISVVLQLPPDWSPKP